MLELQKNKALIKDKKTGFLNKGCLILVALPFYPLYFLHKKTPFIIQVPLIIAAGLYLASKLSTPWQIISGPQLYTNLNPNTTNAISTANDKLAANFYKLAIGTPASSNLIFNPTPSAECGIGIEKKRITPEKPDVVCTIYADAIKINGINIPLVFNLHTITTLGNLPSPTATMLVFDADTGKYSPLGTKRLAILLQHIKLGETPQVVNGDLSTSFTQSFGNTDVKKLMITNSGLIWQHPQLDVSIPWKFGETSDASGWPQFLSTTMQDKLKLLDPIKAYSLQLINPTAPEFVIFFNNDGTLKNNSIEAYKAMYFKLVNMNINALGIKDRHTLMSHFNFSPFAQSVYANLNAINTILTSNIEAYSLLFDKEITDSQAVQSLLNLTTLPIQWTSLEGGSEENRNTYFTKSNLEFLSDEFSNSNWTKIFNSDSVGATLTASPTTVTPKNKPVLSIKYNDAISLRSSFNNPSIYDEIIKLTIKSGYQIKPDNGGVEINAKRAFEELQSELLKLNIEIQPNSKNKNGKPDIFGQYRSFADQWDFFSSRLGFQPSQLKAGSNLTKLQKAEITNVLKTTSMAGFSDHSSGTAFNFIFEKDNKAIGWSKISSLIKKLGFDEPKKYGHGEYTSFTIVFKGRDTNSELPSLQKPGSTTITPPITPAAQPTEYPTSTDPSLELKPWTDGIEGYWERENKR